MLRRDPDRPPRVGFAFLLRAVAGALVVVLCVGSATAAAVLLRLHGFTPTRPPIPRVPPLPPVKPGGPRTLLVLGSDRRDARSQDARAGQQAHSDTIVLVRLDPKRGRVATLSLPRDLAVTLPGHTGQVKINQAYDEGGAALALKTVQKRFEDATGEPLAVNGVIDVSFNGFQRAVNYVGGVYVDIDHRYYNPPGSGFAAIDVPAGYQRLVGSDALDYVRYRHTDSDLYRGARQQDFLRQAAQGRAVQDLRQPGDAADLVRVFRDYFRFDQNFLRAKNLLGLLKTSIVLAAKHAPINQIALPGITESANPAVDTRLFVSDAHLKVAYQRFMTGADATNPARRTSPARAAAARRVTGLVDARRQGEDMAVLSAAKLKLPFYFPARITGRARYASGTPRVYTLADEQGHRRSAYRIVLSTGEPGEYYGVQGLAWRDPPILAAPDRVRTLKNGRRLLLFYDGARLRMVGFKTPGAAYYVTNTVGRRVSNAQLLAIAGSLTHLR